MGVVATEVRPDQEPGHPGGVRVGHAEGGEDARREDFQTVDSEGLHVRVSRKAGVHGHRR